MAKNQVTLTFAGDSKNLEKSFDNVGAGAKKMGASVEDQASKIDRLGEAGGNTETRFLGLGAGISGVSTLLSGDLNAETAAMAVADLGDAVEHTLAPLLSQGKALLASGANAVTSAGQHAMAAATTGAGWVKMGVLATINAAKMAAAWVISLGPIALVVAAIAGVIAILAALGVDFDDVKRIAKAAWNGILGAGRAVFNWLRANWPTVLAILTGPFGLAVLAIVKHRDKIVGFFRSVPGAIRGFFSGLARTIAGPFESAFRMVKRVWNSTLGGFGFSFGGWDPPGPGPKVPGFSFRIPSMHTGGIVPGAPGQEQLILAMAGERVSRPGASGGSIIIDMRGAIVADDRQFEAMVRKAFARMGAKGTPITVRGRTV